MRNVILLKFDEFKNHLRNIKYFLHKGNLNSRFNLCNIQQSNFSKNFVKLSVVGKNTHESITFPSFHQCRLSRYKYCV